MSDKATPSQKLHRLLTSVEDEILSLADDELLKEVRDNGEDPGAIAGEMRAIINKEVLKSRRHRLSTAREQYNIEVQKRQGMRRISLPIEEAVLLIREAIQGRATAATLAFRDGKGVSEDDLLSIVEDLRSLGLIDESVYKRLTE